MSLKMLNTNPLLAKNPIHQFKFITTNNVIIDFDIIGIKNKSIDSSTVEKLLTIKKVSGSNFTKKKCIL